MRTGFTIGSAAIMLLSLAGAAAAQGSASTGQSVPDSNMSRPSGNTDGASNGTGEQCRLTGNNGSHSSTVTGPAAAAQIVTSPKPANGSHNDPQVEKDPAQGGSQSHR